MKLAWRSVYGVIPVPIVYTDGLPEGVGGQARGPLARIRPKYLESSDEGIHQHELEHVRQFYALWLVGAAINAPIAYYLAEAFGAFPGWQASAYVAAAFAVLHPLLYTLSQQYRFRAEVAAYRLQVSGGRLSPTEAAEMIATRYGLSVTPAEAYTALLWF